MKYMGKPLPILCVLALLLSACGVRANIGTEPAPALLVSAAEASQEDLPELQTVSRGGENFDAYLEGYYGLDPDTVEEGVLRLAGGVEALELAALRFSDNTAAREAAKALEDYRESRAGAFAGYAPEQADMVERGVALAKGNCALLLICPDPEAATDAVNACFRGDPVPTAALPTETPAPTKEPAEEPETWEPGFDPEGILTAWRTGDAGALSEKNRAILEKAEEVMESVLSPGMNNYKKELAIHDWMISHGEYDPGALDHTDLGSADPDNDNPYGFLFHGVGVCLGYSSTFQLFMDLLDIRCITVHGSAYAEREEHAWNMVCLDGEWYCVDVTWDDPLTYGDGRVSDRTAHQYFNCTSEYLRVTDHYWDEESVPEAAATALAWHR